ncbi:hypothetical protein AS888_23545 [Peribacillus simplex]|uniref:Uncharacterized protein n=1 Tax=Peribacillus simplex TaxID=1478 RepID=A0A109MW97_9BACI|nr:hypothetical protein [Peribacillus simplex]KWW16959.1 hypothetical protein AS888_23545 [Peribacillus simplex]
MFGTVKYFTDHLKTQVMYNFSGGETISLSGNREKLTEEINGQAISSAEKELFSRNLEVAYESVVREMFGETVLLQKELS